MVLLLIAPFFIIFVIGLTVIKAYFFLKVMDVELNTAGYFVVSNFGKFLKIPLQDIKKISKSYFFTPTITWITLNKPSKFGKKIAFIPKSHFWSSFFGSHPVVDELEDLISLHRESGKK